MSDRPESEERESYLSRMFNSNVRQQVAVTEATEQALLKLSSADKGDVKSIAASQIELLTRFYDLSLMQAQRSFRWALVASMVGLGFFLAAVGFMLWDVERVAMITVVSGALIEFIAGVNFYLYGKTLAQLNLFQSRLEVTQRFLLANSLTESLGPDYQDRTRAQLIARLADTSGTYQMKVDEEGRVASTTRRSPQRSDRERPEPNRTNADSPVAANTPVDAG